MQLKKGSMATPARDNGPSEAEFAFFPGVWYSFCHMENKCTRHEDHRRLHATNQWKL